MMDLRPNTFYVRKLVQESIPLINEFPDLPLSGSSSSNNVFFAGDTTLSTGDVTSFHILSGNTSSDLNYGDYKLRGGYLKYFTESTFSPAMSDESHSVKLWDVKDDYNIEAGGFTLAQSGTTGTAMGHNIGAYYVRPWSSLPNMVETFDDKSATHSVKMGALHYSGPYIDAAEWTRNGDNFMSGYSKAKRKRIKALGNRAIRKDRNGMLVVPLDGPFYNSANTTFYMIGGVYDASYSRSRGGPGATTADGTIGLQASDIQQADRIYNHKTTTGIKNGPSVRAQNSMAGDTDWFTIRFARESPGVMGSEEGVAPTPGGLVTTYAQTKNIQNPFSADLANAFIYSNVQISSDVGDGGNGNALRIYHEWDYADSNREVEVSELAAVDAIGPQTFKLGCYDLPVPLVADASLDRVGDRRCYLPRMEINMNIKQLGPTPLYAETTNAAVYCSGGTNFTLYPAGTNAAAIADYFFSGNTGTKTRGAAASDSNKDQSESLLRSVAVVFSNYKPLEEHKTLDQFLDYGLSNYYGQPGTNTGQKKFGIVGGILFRNFGMQNGTDAGTITLVPPGFDNQFIYAQPIPVTYNTDIVKEVSFSGSKTENTMITYASGGLVGFQPDATVGSNVFDRRPINSGSMNVLATVGTQNIRNSTTSLLGPTPDYKPNSVQLPMNSYFNMSVFTDILATGTSYANSVSPYAYWPYTGTSAWPAGGKTGGSTAFEVGGSQMRVVFDTQSPSLPVSATAQTPTNDPTKQLLYLDIPFPHTKDDSYSFTDLDEDGVMLYPRFMTIWVQNYRWVKGQQNAGRPGPADSLFFYGDTVASGSSMQAEVLIDSISLHDYHPESGVENLTATNVSQGGFNINNNSVLSPFTKTLSKGNYRGSGFDDDSGTNNGAPRPFEYVPTSPATYLCMGFDSKTNFPLTTSAVSRGGYLFFNDYYSDDRDNQERINPTNDMIGLGANLSTLTTLSGSTVENLQKSGQMFVGSVRLNTTVAYDDPIADGPARFTVDNNTATDNAISLASGTNNTNLSVDGFSQKGFARFNVSGSSTAGGATYGTWGQRENALVSTKIIGFSQSSDLDDNQLRVKSTSIFNPLSNAEEYVIYRPYQNGDMAAAGCTYALTGVKLNGPNSIEGDIVTFASSVQNANSGDLLLDNKWISELYISPWKYWVTLMFKGDRNFTSRAYGQICMVNETPSVASIANLTGTTWNESNYTYNSTLTGAAESGDSSQYLHKWDLTNLGGTTIINSENDYGHGAASEEEPGAGFVDSLTVVSGTYATFNLNKYVTDSTVGENSSFMLLQQLENVSSNKTARLIGINNTTKTNYQYYVPRFYYQFEDKLPKTPTLTVKPAVDLLNKNVNLYDITSENMNAVKFEWDEQDDDIWYRYLICSTGSINNKYQHARLWMPLNEEPASQQPDIITLTHTCYNVVSGTSMTITNGGKVPSDINGLCGYAPYFKDASGAYLQLAVGTSGFDFPFTSNGSDSVTEYSAVLHCTPDEGLSDAKYTILHKGSSDALSGITVLISGADSNAPRIQYGVNGTYLTSSPITLDGSPISIVYTYKKDSEVGPDAKLYINGALEDTNATMPTLPTTNVLLQIGANNNTNHFKGQIEEIIFYDVELKVPDSATDYLYSTANVADKSGSDIITHTAKLFLFDYHNIRGRSFKEVTSSNQVSWEATPL